jgi:hypothetical protein
MKPPNDTNYIIEFRQVGNHVKVTAVDPRTMLEVSIIGSTRATERDLALLAVKKLEYVLAKRNTPSE